MLYTDWYILIIIRQTPAVLTMFCFYERHIVMNVFFPQKTNTCSSSFMDTVSSWTAGVPLSQDTTITRLFEIQIITLMTKFQIYVCLLVLFSYMIFWILMTLNNIVSFLNVEPKTARPAIFWLQKLISPAT